MKASDLKATVFASLRKQSRCIAEVYVNPKSYTMCWLNRISMARGKTSVQVVGRAEATNF